MRLSSEVADVRAVSADAEGAHPGARMREPVSAMRWWTPHTEQNVRNEQFLCWTGRIADPLPSTGIAEAQDRVDAGTHRRGVWRSPGAPISPLSLRRI